jgi:cell division protein FtsQ
MMDEIDCHEIEQYLLEHEMVRDALCYKSPFGGLYIRVTQRIPELLVVTHDARYYVDSDRRVMPIRRQIDVDVPVVRGAVNERAAREEYYDFAMWLKEDRYWRDVISEVYVHSPKYLVLTQKDDHAKIVLGTMDGYAEKLAKLHKLYTRGLSEIEHPVYKEYDLRFEGQVVARK